MNWPTGRTVLCISFIASSVILIAIGETSAAVNPAKIQQSILKAQNYIVRQQLSSPHGTIAALAYVKSGGDKKIAAIEQAVEYVLKKNQSGTYFPQQHTNYEAGVDLMFLEAIDAQAYRPQMEAIVAYLLGNQRPNGAWFYGRGGEPDCCDTSITQYAVLGLWAAARAEIEIPAEVWEKVAQWHISRQCEDGGFAYQPFQSQNRNEEHLRSRPTMAAAGASSLMIIRRILFNDAEADAKARPAESKRRFGVLERFTEDKPVKKPIAPDGLTVRPAAIDKAINEAVQWTSSHFVDKSLVTESFFLYYLYCIERVAALSDVEKLGKQDWYEAGSDELLRRQAPDGSWTDSSGPLASTAFGLMFLSKATTTIVAPKKPVVLLGGGLQAGGRGLPDNLDAVQMKEGTVAARKIVGPVDNLLIELERSSDAKVEAVQAAVVDAVQLDRPEELIGQIGRLRKLATDSRVEVRRTALWALGRSGDFSTAKLLIEGLADPDISVVREASLGLCILSRRPEGCGEPIDPTDDSQMKLKEDATDLERKTRLDDWKSESKKRWLDWYQKYRPYDERDDRSALKRLFK